MSVVEYEKKYTELSKYAASVLIDERARCKRFEDGLKEEICTPVTASVNRDNFTNLVEATMRVEKSLLGNKT